MRSSSSGRSVNEITRNTQSGLTLVELALVMLILGVVMVAAIRIALPLIEMARRMETVEKIKKIEDALSLYAIQNYRIPCPGVPVKNTSNPVANGYGLEKNNGIAVPNAASRCGSSPSVDWRGIVPFRTLGLPEDYSRDAWGNLFTYAISPVFALPAGAAENSVHARCRTREWFYLTEDRSTPVYRSRNAAKAGFCCPGDDNMGSATTIRIRDRDNQAVPYRSRIRSMPGAEVANAHTPYSNLLTYAPVDQTPLGVAYVVVSHGPNGEATAFDGITDGRSVIPSVSTNACEHANANEANESGARTYRDCPIAEDVATNANDDIVSWKTQDMIFAAENQSCAIP